MNTQELIELDTTIPAQLPIEFTLESESTTSILYRHQSRKAWMLKGMFAFVAKNWTTPLAKWIGSRKVLEVMSGAGWLAKALIEDGVDIVATDNNSWAEDKEGKRYWPMVSPILKKDCVAAAKEIPADILLISWPYMDNQAYLTIKAFYETNPQGLVVYIGEQLGGCTASKKFFDAFEEIEDDEFNKAVANYRAWTDIHDKIFLGRYNPEEDPTLKAGL